MDRGTGFSFDTMDEKNEFKAYAKSKGMTLSALVKYATYQYKARYPLTAAEAAGERRKPGRPRKQLQTVQSELSDAPDGQNGIGHPKPEQDASLAARAQGNLNSKNKTKTLSTEAASPLYHAIWQTFLEVRKREGFDGFTNYGKEGRAAKEIEKRCIKANPDSPDDFAKRVIAALCHLKQTDHWYATQPLVPSFLASSGVWDRVLETMRGKPVDEVALSVARNGVAS